MYRSTPNTDRARTGSRLRAVSETASARVLVSTTVTVSIDTTAGTVSVGAVGVPWVLVTVTVSIVGFSMMDSVKVLVISMVPAVIVNVVGRTIVSTMVVGMAKVLVCVAVTVSVTGRY